MAACKEEVLTSNSTTNNVSLRNRTTNNLVQNKNSDSNMTNGSVTNAAAKLMNGTMKNKGDKAATSDQGSTRNDILILLAIFLCALCSLSAVYYTFPKLEVDEKQHMKLPRNITDAKNLGTVLSRYKDRYFLTVTAGFFVTYIFLQSFAIPGSIFLSVLSGFLFPFPLALFLVCLCSAIGASLCYLLSHLTGRRLVLKYFPEKAATWSAHVNKYRENLLNYIIFLRITPFLPNWFINITSPIIGVSLWPFFFGTFVGVAPPSFIAIQAGTTLHQLTSSTDFLSWKSVSFLALLATFSLLPVFFKKRLREKFQ